MKKNIILVTDIFGLTTHVEDMANYLSRSFNVNIVDPYDGQHKNFSSEDSAYKFFMGSIGIDGFNKKISQYLNNLSSKNLIIVGFSVGATVVWNLSGDESLRRFLDVKLICFYGSQIRNYLDIKNLFPVDIIISNHEKSFDVDFFYKSLEGRSNVFGHKEVFGHGFMNRLSSNFSEVAYRKYVHYLECMATQPL